MKILINILSGFIIAISVCSTVFAGWPQIWQITKTSADETLSRAAFIRNPAGFTFLIEKEGERAVSHLYIPLLYSLNFSTDKSYIIVQIDENPVKQIECQYLRGNGDDITFQARGIIFYPNNDFIEQLMQGNNLGIKYYNNNGWSDYFYFTLKDSSKVLGEILGIKQSDIKFVSKNQITNKNIKNGRKWEVELTTDNLGSTYKIAQITNVKDFVFSIETGLYILGTINIPNNYPKALASKGSLEFQVDNLKIKNKKPEIYHHGKQIVINLDEDIESLKNGSVVKCSYFSNQGKISIEFKLNGFSDAFSKI